MHLVSLMLLYHLIASKNLSIDMTKNYFLIVNYVHYFKREFLRLGKLRPTSKSK
jgi:hypothetical protein